METINKYTLKQYEYLGDTSKDIVENIYNEPMVYNAIKWNPDTLHNIKNRLDISTKLEEILARLIPYLQGYVVKTTIYRWIMTQRLIDTKSTDPLIPTIKDINIGLDFWLRQHNISQDIINKIHFEFNNFCENVVNNINIIENDLPMASRITIKSKNHNKSIQYAEFKPLFIDNKRYSILFNSYKNDDKIATNDPDGFKLALWKLLVRYEPIMTPGYHAAIPENVFDVLKEELGTKCELYASPMNNYLNRYCSMFPDTDSIFGSIGNLLTKEILSTLFIDGGSFEVNPPFTEEHLSLTTMILLKLLKTIKKPLTFVIIYPKWDDLWVYDEFIGSKYNKLLNKVITFESGKHIYSKVNNYRINQYQVAKHISVMFVLSNDANLVISNNFVEKVKQHFCVNL